MSSTEKEDVYATVLLNDSYLPGALILAHSLLDAGTSKKLAVLVTPDTVSGDVITQLRTVYNYVIPVTRIQNEVTPGNLQLMSRPDLHSAFTKIHLWNQTQFRKIVYMDSDVVAYRAPDELFDLPQPFAAAPDIGWPDLFNTGVMVITPDAAEFASLQAKAQQGSSFDGADQGLLNMHFPSYHRLSFTYNVTPSAHYQYLPAYRHFQSSINLVHFIGPEKPWFQGRASATSTASPAYNEMINKWWAVYDKHYSREMNPPEILQFFVKGEYQPTVTRTLTSNDPSFSLAQRPVAGGSFNAHYTNYSPYGYGDNQVPPPIFPWETYKTKPVPARLFNQPATPAVLPERPVAAAPTPAPEPKAARALSITASTAGSTTGYSDNSEPVTPTTPTTVTSVGNAFAPSDPWTSYSRANAWDDVPQIERYVENIQKHRRAWSRGQLPLQKQAGFDSPVAGAGTRVTDFPSAIDRPSLPVTPAPVGRPAQLVLQTQTEHRQLPAAAGVPEQSDWDPAERLQRLALQQSQVLLKNLGSGAGSQMQAGRVVSPQPVRPGGLETSSVRGMDAGNMSEAYAQRMASQTIEEPSYSGPGLAFEKHEGIPEHDKMTGLSAQEARDLLEA